MKTTKTALQPAVTSSSAVSQQRASGSGAAVVPDFRSETANAVQLQQLANRFTSGSSPASPPVQRMVKHSRKDNDYYSTYDPATRFDSEADATDYDALLEMQFHQQQQAKKAAKWEKQSKKYAEKKKELDEKYKGYTPPESGQAIVYKEKDSEFDLVPYSNMQPNNVKEFFGHAIDQRRANEFNIHGIKMNGQSYLLQKGYDIGVTPLNLRPDLVKKQPKEKKPFFSRNGQPKPYDVLASTLDAMVNRLVDEKNDYNAVRQRVGRDIERLTRNSEPKGQLKYEEEELLTMKELAVILRLDKGRVPDATYYIRERITSTDTFKSLLVDETYEGAASGGVKKLRGRGKKGGYESEGSDIDALKEEQVDPLLPPKNILKRKPEESLEKAMLPNDQDMNNNNNINANADIAEVAPKKKLRIDPQADLDLQQNPQSVNSNKKGRGRPKKNLL